MGFRERVQDIKVCRFHGVPSPNSTGVPQSKHLVTCRRPRYLGHGRQDVDCPEVTLAKPSYQTHWKGVSRASKGLCDDVCTGESQGIGMAGGDSRRQQGEYSRSVDEPRAH